MKFKWPRDFEAALVIGVDDVHPESSIDGVDCGGDLDQGALGLFYEFLKTYKLKATIFVTPCHIYKPQLLGIEQLHAMLRRLRKLETCVDQIFMRILRTWEVKKFRVDSEANSNFASFLRGLAQSGYFEIGLHGLLHFSHIPPYSSEFKYLNEFEAKTRIMIAIYIMERAGIPFEKVFSPPGWGVNQGLLSSLSSLNFTCIAGSADFSSPVRKGTSSEGGLKNVSLIYPSILSTRYGNIVNIPRNFTPHRNDLKRAKQIIESNGLLSIHLHVENEYHGVFLGNGITKLNLNKLKKLIEFLENEYGTGYYWIASFDEIAKHTIMTSLA